MNATEALPEIERVSPRRVAINGVPFYSWPLDPDPEAALARVIAAYEGGTPQRVLALELRCSVNTVSAILRAAGFGRHRGGRAGR